MTIGEHMKAARLSRGLTRPELQRLSGVSEGSIFTAEKDRGFVSVLNLISLSDALGVSLDEYIGRTPPVYIQKYTKNCGNCQHCERHGRWKRKCGSNESEYYCREVLKSDVCEHWKNYDLEMYGEEET